MSSSHNFGGHCGGNTYFSNFVFTVYRQFLYKRPKKLLPPQCPASKVMRRTHVNMNLSSLQVVNHHFTVNCQFTLVNCCFTVNCHFTVNHCFTVICQFTVICHFTVIRQFTVKWRFSVNHFERPLAEGQ